MKTKLVLFLTIVLFVQFASAQEYAFKVLVNKGNSEVKAGNSWQTIKVGASLNANDELKVPENAYVGLVHKTGKPLEVKKAGKYKVSELAAQISGGASVLTKYTDFILSSNTDKKNNLAATGAVHRGTEITLNIPKAEQSPLIYNDEIIISWDADKLPPPVIITFNSMFEDELSRQEVKGNQVKINLSDKTFANEDNILVTVTSLGDSRKVSKTHTLKRLSKADKDRIGKLLNEIQPQTEEPTALNQFVLAGFYEQNNLLIDAASAYLEAISLAPDVAEFKEAYENFLVRNNLKMPAIQK